MRKFVRHLLIACLALFARATAAFAADGLNAVRSQIEDAGRRDAEIGDQIKENDKLVRRTKEELVGVAAALAGLESDKAAAEGKIKLLEKRRAELLANVRANEANLADAAAGLLAISRSPPVFDDDAAEDYVLTGALLSAIAEQFDRDMQAALLEIAELEKLRRRLEKERTTLGTVEQKRKKEQADLDALLQKRYDQNHQLRARQYELRERLASLSAKAKSLAELANYVAPTAADGFDAGAVAAPKFGAKIMFPAPGMLILRFGDKSASGRRSDGWLVRTNAGALVRSPMDGKITFADSFPRYGKVAIIDHQNGYHTALTGMDALTVLVGQDVLAGEPIGRMPEKSPEIYLELYRRNTAIDPAALFADPK